MSGSKRRRRNKAEARELRRKIGALALRGLGATEIGRRLSISRQLVRHHLERQRREWIQDLAQVDSRALLQEALLQLQADRSTALDQLDFSKSEAERRRWLEAAQRSTAATIRLLLEAPGIVGPRRKRISLESQP